MVDDFCKFDDGAVILGEFPNVGVVELIHMLCPTKGIQLVIIDPDYENLLKINENDIDICSFVCRSMKVCESVCSKGSAAYIIGKVGSPGCRPFYRILIKLEQCTDWRLLNKIVWRKRRCEGGIDNYSECYDEIGYFVLGDGLGNELIQPKLFNSPFLDKPRSRFGKKSKNQKLYVPRNNVWLDISEMIKNKLSKNQKPEKLIEIPIQVHTKVGDLVFDPFSRHAVTAIVARKLGRRFIVVASSKKEFDYCVFELSKTKKNI